MSSADGRWAIALLASLLGSACASNPAPAGWQPDASDLPRFTRGAWIVVKHHRARQTQGELIAVEANGVQVWTANGLVFEPIDRMRSVRVVLHRPDDTVSGLAAAGGLSALTHGWFFPFTIGFWIAPAVGESYAPFLSPPLDGLDNVRKYARFPQGSPPGLDPATLGERPPGRRSPPPGPPR